eukprot:1558889-Pyramimonas_sp.AAC.1
MLPLTSTPPRRATSYPHRLPQPPLLPPVRPAPRLTVIARGLLANWLDHVAAIARGLLADVLGHLAMRITAKLHALPPQHDATCPM